MTEYISKSAVVAEIKSLIHTTFTNFDEGVNAAAKTLLESIDTLEVKEVDLDRAIDKWIDDAAITHEDCSISDVISTAKHFFELGLKVQRGE